LHRTQEVTDGRELHLHLPRGDRTNPRESTPIDGNIAE
jgi:hypothetical protein